MVGYLTSRQVSHPLRQMAEVAKKIGAGDFAAQAPSWSRDEVGTLGGVLNRMRDRLREKIAESEAGRKEVEAILEGMAEGVVAFDLEGRVLFANRAAGRFLGFEPDSVPGKPFLEVCRLPELHAFSRAVIAEGREIHKELSGFTPGEQVWEVVGVRLPFVFPFASVWIALVGTLALALLVLLLPLRRAVRLRPGDALRYA